MRYVLCAARSRGTGSGMCWPLSVTGLKTGQGWKQEGSGSPLTSFEAHWTRDRRRSVQARKAPNHELVAFLELCPGRHSGADTRHEVLPVEHVLKVHQVQQSAQEGAAAGCESAQTGEGERRCAKRNLFLKGGDSQVEVPHGLGDGAPPAEERALEDLG